MIYCVFVGCYPWNSSWIAYLYFLILLGMWRGCIIQKYSWCNEKEVLTSLVGSLLLYWLQLVFLKEFFTCVPLNKNGVVEWKYQTIGQIGRCFLNQAHLPMSYWLHSFLVATFWSNKLVSRVTNGKSPYDRIALLSTTWLFNSQDVWLHLLSMIPMELQSILNQTCRDWCFVGYATKYKGYLCLEVLSGVVSIFHDVLFDEA